MVTLEAVIAKSELVLVDSSIKAGEDNPRNGKHLTPGEKNAIKRLQTEIGQVSRISRLLEEPQVMTIPEVVQEMNKFMRYAKGYQECYSRKLNGTKQNDEVEFLRQLGILREEANELYKNAERKVLRINHPGFDYLVGMTKFLARALNLKEDTAYLRGKSKCDRAYLSDTDERVCAAALWQSMTQGTTPVVLSNDGDFHRILSVIPWVLGSRHFLPYNRQFIDETRKNQLKLYKLRKNCATDTLIPLYTWRFQWNEDFVLPDRFPLKPHRKTPFYGPPTRENMLSPRETVRIRYEVHQLWEKLYSSLQRP